MLTCGLQEHYYILLVERDDQFNVDTHSLEDLVHLKDVGSRAKLMARPIWQLGFALHQARQSVWGFHTTQMEVFCLPWRVMGCSAIQCQHGFRARRSTVSSSYFRRLFMTELGKDFCCAIFTICC